jgi:hypothetical protein
MSSSLYLAMALTLAAMGGPVHANSTANDERDVAVIPETASFRGSAAIDRGLDSAMTTSVDLSLDRQALSEPSSEGSRSLERRRWRRRTAAPTALRTKAPTSAPVSVCPVPDISNVRCSMSDPVVCTRNQLACPYDILCYATIAGFAQSECLFVTP